ncbi:sigma-70 family RNA polymerase sigma factor [Corallococcus sp. bb12-1]|uniref:RNA polymerase sigma factor n=1 Tax=Corallococcus sp. bb12-1 TaxID=2996784 RepID=UPI00227200C3|nr:sigma-70 family RNA polymerase sigma factor [Corallococcus sp. bb12-1]MCY1043667.1 sigma-70 family RNA polymerase sigma factor [Corallococcus sp. bb12-1]
MPSTVTDALRALILEAQDGSVRAFELLIASHLPRVRRFARAFAASDADVDDLAQEALVKVYRSLRSFRFQSAFETWLYTVVRNAFYDATRSRAGRERSREEPLEQDHIRAPSNAESADEGLMRAQERDRLWRALRALPEEFRTAVVLFDVEGHTYEEVAAIEGVPVGTVKSRLSRGRAQLKVLLAGGQGPGAPADEHPAGTSSRDISSHAARSGK